MTRLEREMELLAESRDEAVRYAQSLERSRDEAIRYATALERSRDEALRRLEELLRGARRGPTSAPPRRMRSEGRTGPRSPADARAAVGRHAHWYHRIRVAEGLETPGSHHSARALAQLDALGLPRDCSGRSVLDIGCRDGYFTFEMERRGADVVSIDYRDAGDTGFEIAAELLGSRAEYTVQNVYDLDSETHGKYDIVLFLGVLYHLRHPLLALDRIRSVMKPESSLFVETQLSTAPPVASSSSPAWQLLPARFAGDPTNVWAPNPSGLEQVLERCELTVLATAREGDRGFVAAQAMEDSSLRYQRFLDASAGL